MKGQFDDSNYQAMISKVIKGSLDQKSQMLKKLLYLYENFRSKIYLYERRITQSLELALLIEKKDISLTALNLLAKIISNTSTESDIMMIIQKKMLSKVVSNLGSIEIAIRKVSHRCITEYLRKFAEFQTITAIYLKCAFQQQETNLKLKAMYSFNTLLKQYSKFFRHSNENSKILIQQLIHFSNQNIHLELKKCSLLCLIFILRIQGSQITLREIDQRSKIELYYLKNQNQQLSSLLELIMQYQKPNIKDDQASENSIDSHNNAPSPKFVSVIESQNSNEDHTNLNNNNKNSNDNNKMNTHYNNTLIQHQQQQLQHCEAQIINSNKVYSINEKTELYGIFNDVSFAQDFLKKLQKSSQWLLDEIKNFIPYLQKYLINESIKLFSISKKIVEIILDYHGNPKQYYIIIVPCVVAGIGNKKSIVRKNIDKLIRSYIKYHTQIWLNHFIERFAIISNYKIKQFLSDLFMHAYKIANQCNFYHARIFEIFDHEINDKNSHLKWKAVDCIVLVLEKQGKTDKQKQEMMQTLSEQSYYKVLKKINRTQQLNEKLSPLSPLALQKKPIRLVTEQEKLNNAEIKVQKQPKSNLSEQKRKNKVHGNYKQRRIRRSQVDMDIIRGRRAIIMQCKNAKQERTSIQKLPELRKGKNSNGTNINNNNKRQISESPVKRGICERNIIYLQLKQLHQIENPIIQLEKALLSIHDNNWNVQFQSIGIFRIILQFHNDVINDQHVNNIIVELLYCLNNSKSGVNKLALMCLGEFIVKFNKKISNYTENIILTLIKKSLGMTEFLQEQSYKCMKLCVEYLKLNKIMNILNSLKDNKSNQIKLNVLLMIQIMIYNQKAYRKQSLWLWPIILDMHQQPQFNIRSECKKLIKIIVQKHKQWKNIVYTLTKQNLEKVDRILKNINQKGQNSWFEAQCQQFQRIIQLKLINSKYFTTQFHKFEEMDSKHSQKRNWKERIQLINETFNLAFEYPGQFESNSNSKKYMLILFDQLDQRNPGLLINSINILNKCIEYLPNLVQQCLSNLLQKILIINESKKGQLSVMIQKSINRILIKYDLNKIMKEYLKLSLNYNAKVKNEALNQVIYILKEGQNKQNHEISECNHLCKSKNIRISESRNKNQQIYNGNSVLNTNTQNILMKVLSKLSVDRQYETNIQFSQKIKEIVKVCYRKFGPQFNNKLMQNEKLAQIMVE